MMRYAAFPARLLLVALSVTTALEALTALPYAVAAWPLAAAAGWAWLRRPAPTPAVARAWYHYGRTGVDGSE